MDTRSGQHKWNMATGASHVVGSPATERPNLERQADLIDNLADSERLLRWKGEHSCDSGVHVIMKTWMRTSVFIPSVMVAEAHRSWQGC